LHKVGYLYNRINGGTWWNRPSSIYRFSNIKGRRILREHWWKWLTVQTTKETKGLLKNMQGYPFYRYHQVECRRVCADVPT